MTIEKLVTVRSTVPRSKRQSAKRADTYVFALEELEYPGGNMNAKPVRTVRPVTVGPEGTLVTEADAITLKGLNRRIEIVKPERQSAPPPPAEDDWSSLTKAELMEELGDRDIEFDVRSTKAVLIALLEDPSDEDDSEDPNDEDEDDE